MINNHLSNIHKLSDCENYAWKKIQAWTGNEPWALRLWSSALPTELSRQLEASHIVSSKVYPYMIKMSFQLHLQLKYLISHVFPWGAKTSRGSWLNRKSLFNRFSPVFYHRYNVRFLQGSVVYFFFSCLPGTKSPFCYISDLSSVWE